MPRIRQIAPGILVNEELGALGRDAYILFIGLWMIADREGRLEDRPARIRMQAMSLWDDVTNEAVENLLAKLDERHFIHRYSVGRTKVIHIVNWQKYQHPHRREAASVLPPPQSALAPQQQVADNQHVVQGMSKDSTRHVLGKPDASKNVHEPGGIRNTEYTSTSYSSTRARAAEPPDDDDEPPTPQPPGREQALPTTSSEKPKAPRRPPQRERQHRARAVDFWPHQPDDVAHVRACLDELARLTHRARCDDELVRRVLDAGHGARGPTIQQALALSYKQRRFARMYSWGLVPLVVGQCFDRRAGHVAA